VLEIGSGLSALAWKSWERIVTHEQALAKSAFGVMTKLSFVLDQLIKCDILVSSSILC